MIDPRTQYILHQEKQSVLMAQIQRNIEASERNGDTVVRQPVKDTRFSLGQGVWFLFRRLKRI